MLVNQKLTFAAYDKIGGVAPRVALFIQKLLFSAQKLRLVVLFIQKLLSSIQKLGSCAPYFARHIAAFFRKFSLRAAENGSILIEFAVCMPVLIILLFYIHDLVKIKRYYSQTEFVAQQMANILQNIAKTRAVTVSDLKNAASLSWLTVYPGKTMYKTGEGYGFYYWPWINIHYVGKESNGKASCKWGYRLYANNTPDDWIKDPITNVQWSAVTWGTNTDPSSIYPTLKLENNKVIIESTVYWYPSNKNASGNKANSSGEAFGCRFVNPKHSTRNNYFFFSSVVIFTPNSGFSETVPS